MWWPSLGGRGVVEAVTGAGKTRVGVAAALDEPSSWKTPSKIRDWALMRASSPM
jgi:hypothetical protein